jgi:Zn-dependent membrane protease YugP
VTNTTSPEELAAAICLGTAMWASGCLVYFLLLPVDFAAIARASVDTVRDARMQTALTLAALLLITIPTGDPR